MYCGTGESEKRENCHRCYLSLDPSSKIVATIIFIIISIRLEPFRIIIPDPSLGLVWLLEPSSKCVLFWIFSIQLLKKHTPEPGNYSLLWQVDAKLITALLLLLITQLLIQIISYLIDNKIITLLLMLLITQLLVQALFDIFNIR